MFIMVLDEVGIDYVCLVLVDCEYKGLFVNIEDCVVVCDMMLYLIGLGYCCIGFVVCDLVYGVVY